MVVLGRKRERRRDGAKKCKPMGEGGGRGRENWRRRRRAVMVVPQQMKADSAIVRYTQFSAPRGSDFNCFTHASHPHKQRASRELLTWPNAPFCRGTVLVARTIADPIQSNILVLAYFFIFERSASHRYIRYCIIIRIVCINCISDRVWSRSVFCMSCRASRASLQAGRSGSEFRRVHAPEPSRSQVFRLKKVYNNRLANEEDLPELLLCRRGHSREVLAAKKARRTGRSADLSEDDMHPVKSTGLGGLTTTVGSNPRRQPALGGTVGAAKALVAVQKRDKISTEGIKLAFAYQCDQPTFEGKQHEAHVQWYAEGQNREGTTHMCFLCWRKSYMCNRGTRVDVWKL